MIFLEGTINISRFRYHQNEENLSDKLAAKHITTYQISWRSSFSTPLSFL